MDVAIPHQVKPHAETGIANGKLAIWLFLASEIMLFGALFSSYVVLRVNAPTWPRGDTILNVPLATVNTFVLIFSSVTVVMAWHSLKMGNLARGRMWLGVTFLMACTFLVIKYFEYSHKFHHHLFPSNNNFLGIYFTLTGLHGLHVIGGMVVFAYLMGPGAKLWHRDPEFYTNRIENTGLYWHFVDLVWIFLFPSLYLM